MKNLACSKNSGNGSSHLPCFASFIQQVHNPSQNSTQTEKTVEELTLPKKLEQTHWMVCRPSHQCTPRFFHLGLYHIILANQTKMSKGFCFPKRVVCFKVPSACD